MKLAKNSGLERDLLKLLRSTKPPANAKQENNVITFFSAQEQQRVERTLDKLAILGHKDVVLIDARNDNKPSGSKAA